MCFQIKPGSHYAALFYYQSGKACQFALVMDSQHNNLLVWMAPGQESASVWGEPTRPNLSHSQTDVSDFLFTFFVRIWMRLEVWTDHWHSYTSTANEKQRLGRPPSPGKAGTDRPLTGEFEKNSPVSWGFFKLRFPKIRWCVFHIWY